MYMYVSVAEWSKAPGCKARGFWFDSRSRHIFMLKFALASRSSQPGEAHTNEIKHNIHKK